MALAEPGEEPFHRGEALRAVRLGGRVVRAEEEVLPHGEMGEQPAALQHVREAAVDPRESRQAIDAPAVDLDAARLRGDQPGHAVEEGGLPGAVRAQEGDDLARAHLERDVPQHLEVPVRDREPLDPQHG